MHFLGKAPPHNKHNSNNINNATHHHSGNRRKILIVDDEPLLALSNFKPNFYGLALLDIRMPKMNGFELYKKIKDIDNKIEACFITAFEDYREEFKESFPELEEAKYFIRKPKAIEDLVKHVAAILG